MEIESLIDDGEAQEFTNDISFMKGAPIAKAVIEKYDSPPK